MRLAWFGAVGLPAKGALVLALVCWTALCTTLDKSANNTDTVTTDKAQTKTATIHVGPHKTGSTTIQNLMCSSLREDLAEDGYSVPMNIPGPFTEGKSMANLAIHLQNGNNEAAWSAFETFLSENTNSSILFSSEELDKPSVNITKLRSSLLEAGYKVKVVVAYRRLFEWISSLYAETYVIPVNHEIPSLVEWSRNNALSSQNPLQPSVVAARYRTYFDDVQVVNVHDEESLGVNFFCSVLRNENGHACQKIKAHDHNTRMNMRKNDLDARRICYAAQKQGLVKRNETSKLRIASVQAFLSKSKDAPMDCLDPDEVDALWKASLKQEQEMVPTWFQQNGGEAQLKNVFEAFQESGSLCSVNVAGVLEAGSFQEFLSDNGLALKS